MVHDTRTLTLLARESIQPGDKEAPVLHREQGFNNSRAHLIFRLSFELNKLPRKRETDPR
jgi:hypothetical protein